MQNELTQVPWKLQSSPPTPSTPRSFTGLRPRTASEILASFSPRPQPKKSPSQVVSPPSVYPIAMMADRRLRHKQQPVSYEISSDEENADSLADSSFSSPAKPSRKRVSIIDLEDELEEVEPPKTPPPRLSAAGHSLRQHNDLKLSLQARENADKPRFKRRKTSKSKSKRAAQIKLLAPQKSARNEVRDYINTETAAKRAKFFLAKRDVFLPLLPEGNYVQKLETQCAKDVGDESVGYKVIEKQPNG